MFCWRIITKIIPLPQPQKFQSSITINLNPPLQQFSILCSQKSHPPSTKNLSLSPNSLFPLIETVCRYQYHYMTIILECFLCFFNFRLIEVLFPMNPCLKVVFCWVFGPHNVAKLGKRKVGEIYGQKGLWVREVIVGRFIQISSLTSHLLDNHFSRQSKI